MSFFSKKIADLTFEDVESLVTSQVAENEILDYKRQMPKNQDIANLISAFANTYGGYIVIGVSEQESTNLPDKIVGTLSDFADVGNKVDSICIDLIQPPVISEQHTVFNTGKTKAVHVIKVEESDLTPHAVNENRTVYVKLGAQKRKASRQEYEEATLSHIDNLKNRRQGFVSFKQELLEQDDNWRGEFAQPSNMNQFRLSLRAVPEYPRGLLIKHDSLYDVANGAVNRFHDKYNVGIALESLTNIDYGFITRYQFNSVPIRYYMSFNCFGLFSISFIEEMLEERHMPFELMTRRVYQLTSLWKDFQETIGYKGSYLLELELSNLKSTKLSRENSVLIHLPFAPEYYNELCGTLTSNKSISWLSKDSQLSDYLADFYGRFLFLYGLKEGTRAFGDHVYKLWCKEYLK